MNSNQEVHRKDRYETAASAITFLYRAVVGAVHITSRAITKKSVVVVPDAPVKVEQPVSDTPMVARFRAADQVFSDMFGPQKVNFYLYNSEKTILAVARKDGVERKAHFTQAVANECGLPFAMQGAVKWIRENGFVPAEAVKRPVVQASKKAPPKTTEKDWEQHSKQAAPAVAQLDTKRPFEGRIVNFGEVTRGGVNGNKPYKTFALTLRNAGIGERDFIGEQLAELIADKGLQNGQLIRVHPLGKRTFEIDVAGIMETRTRNEYSIDIL